MYAGEKDTHMVAAVDQVRAEVAPDEPRSAGDEDSVVLHTRLGLWLRLLDAVLPDLGKHVRGVRVRAR